jgi:hypothetical protein
MLLQPYLWLDASDTSTIIESGGFVSQWNDKSGNGRHVSQAIGTSQPITGTTTQNGLNVIVFDGTNDILTVSPGGTFSRFFTYAFVATPSTETNDWLFEIQGNGQWAVITKFSSRAYEYFEASNGSARFTLGATTLTGYNTGIVSHQGNYVTSLVNGAPSGSATNGGTTDMTLGTIKVGGFSTSLNNASTNFAELLYFNRALANQDLQNLSNYLRQKWATP